jgi:hypothetical protein
VESTIETCAAVSGLKFPPKVLKAYRNGDEEKRALYLGLKPWQASPLDMETSDEPCTHPPETEYAKSWPNAQELRRQLEAACKEQS